MISIKWSCLINVSFSSKKNRDDEKKMSTIYVVVPEDKKAQARKALKFIYRSRPQDNYTEGIKW